jgi:hypothetical protein
MDDITPGTNDALPDTQYKLHITEIGNVTIHTRTIDGAYIGKGYVSALM